LGPCQRIEGFGPEESRCDADSSPLVVSDNKIIFGGDAIYALGTGGKLRWKVPLLNHASSSAALAEDLTVYIGTQDHALMALDARGKVLWQFRTRYHFDATPVVSGSHVYAGCDDGRIYDIDRKTGQANWEVKTRGPIRASAAIGFDGTIYVGSYDGKLYAINGDGSIRWTYRSRGAIHSSPTVDRQGTVIFGSRDDSVYALDAEGKRLWRLRLGGDVDGSIAVAADGLIVVGADDGFLSVLQGP
jgi:outer membrane protein assembly factor BamB